MKKVLIITFIATFIIILALFIVVFWSWKSWKPVTLNKESWVVNLCEKYHDPSTCRKVSTQKTNFLSEEELRWWFSFQESIGKGENPKTQAEYDKYWQDYGKFKQTTPFIDEHVAKIIAQANPIGSTALEIWPIYIFPRSRINSTTIAEMLNGPEKWDSVVKDGEFPNVHYDMLLRKQSTSETIVGAQIVGPIEGEALCRQRTSYNLLIDIIKKKIIYLDREFEYDAENCKIRL